MKKIISTSIITLFLLSASQGVMAQDAPVYFDHTYDYTFARNDIDREISPILIIDNVGKKIQAANGINIIIPAGISMLWDKSVVEVSLEGSAVIGGKMETKSKPAYSENLKTVFFPVKGDFVAGEQVSISGLKVRVYGTASDKRRVGLDINADKIVDYDNFRTITISGTEIRTDFLPPYAVTEGLIKYKDGKITLTWKDSPDLDINKISIQRELIRDEKFSVKLFDVSPGVQTLVDEGFVDNDQVTYKITAKDTADNGSGLLTLSTVVKNIVVAPPVEPPPVPKEEVISPPPVKTEEVKTPSDTGLKQTEAPIQNTFADVSNTYWGFEALNNLYNLKIISGYSDKTIRPDKAILRAEIAKMAYEAFLKSQNLKEAKLDLKDMKKGEWYYSIVAKMVAKGVFTGYKDKTFRPEIKVTRAEALKILLLAAGVDTSKESVMMVSFKDVKKDDWFLSYLNFAVQKKLISGFSDNTFRPDAPATRAEIAVIIDKILKMQIEK